MAGKGIDPYPRDVSDEKWAIVLPYLLLSREDSRERKHELRMVFNAVRHVVRMGEQWCFLPADLPPWWVVYSQMQRWIQAGCFELLLEDVRSHLSEWSGCNGQHGAICIDSRTRCPPGSGVRAGYDGAKRCKGSKAHMSVDAFDHAS